MLEQKSVPISLLITPDSHVLTGFSEKGQTVIQYKNMHLKFRRLQFSMILFHVLHTYHNIHYNSSFFVVVLVTLSIQSIDVQ